MKHLLSLERLDVGRTLALTVGSPSAHRRGGMLKPMVLAMLFLIAGIGQAWGNKTIVFTVGNDDTNSNAASINTNSSDDVATLTSTYCYARTSGMWISSSNNAGTATLTMKTAGQVKATKIVTRLAGTMSKEISIQVTYTDNTTSTKTGLGTATGDTAYALNPEKFIKSIQYTAEKKAKASISQLVIHEVSSGSQKPSLSLKQGNVEISTLDIPAAGTTNQTLTVAYANIKSGTNPSAPTLSYYSNAACTSSTSQPIWLTSVTATNGTTITYSAAANNTETARTPVWMVVSNTVKNSSNVDATVTDTLKITQPAPTGTFALFTGDLVEGDYVLVGYQTSSQKYYAMNDTVTSNQYLGITEVEISSNQIVNPQEALIWSIEESTNGYYIKSGDAYLDDNATSDKNYAQTVTSANKGTTSEWNFAYNNTWTITNYGTTTTKKTLSFNVGANRVACYTGIQSGNTCVYLYKKALPKHAVTFSAASNGNFTVSVAGSSISSGAQVEEGTTVTVAPSPNTYYRIASVTKGGQTITPVNNVYSFTMPTSDVAIAVTFELIPVTAVTLNKSQLELVEGATETLSVSSVTPGNARNTVTWSSTDETVATVTNAGVVNALKAGITTIKATSTVSTTVFGSCVLTVTAPQGHAITITQNTGGTVAANVADVTDVQKDVAVTLTATPDNGYSVSGWTIGGVDAGDLTISQDKTTCSFDMPDAAVTAQASYTHEVAVLKLHDANGESTYDSGNTHYWKESVTLPGTAAACSKKFVGWSVDENCSTAPEIAKSASYTIPNKGTNHLYAVYADGGATNETITKTTSEIVSVKEYTVSTSGNEVCYTSIALDDYITLSTTGAANCGSFWDTNREWRLYQNQNGNAIITAASGCTLTSVKFTFGVKNTGALFDGENAMTSGTAVNASGSSAEYTVGNSGNATNGQIKITEVEVKYTKTGSYSGYTTTCAASPTATIDPEEIEATYEAVEDGVIEVEYAHVDEDNIDVALYNDAECTEAFDGSWLTASLNGDNNIAYTIAVNNSYNDARSAYIKLIAPAETSGPEDAEVIIPVSQAKKPAIFASLQDLVAADVNANTDVTVSFSNVPIKEIYMYYSNRRGLVFNIQKDAADIKIYFNADVPAAWVAGGKVSGTLTACPWKTYDNAWQLAPKSGWAWTSEEPGVGLSYTAPPVIESVEIRGTETHTAYIDGQVFDPAGLEVIAIYDNDDEEDVTTYASWTYSPATLSTSDNKVTATATYNNKSNSKTIDVTVNPIPDKTVEEFIEAGGTRCYLEGIVSNLTNATKGYFDITDATGTLHIYGCDGSNAAGVANGDKVKLIAEVYELYGEPAKPEAKSTQYVSHISPVAITIEDQELAIDGSWTIEATTVPAGAVENISYSIKNDGESSDYVSLSDNGVVTGVAAGTATLIASIPASEGNYLANSVEFTVTVQFHGSITYEEKGGSAVDDVADATALPSTLPTTTREHYSFDGWWTTSNFENGTEAVPGATLTEDVTLYAKWIELPKWSYTYTSNVTLVGGGTSYEDNAKVIKYGDPNNTPYDAIKAGSGSNTGTVSVTLPIGTTELHFHAATWNGGSCTIQLAGIKTPNPTFDLTADAGMTGSVTYTLKGDMSGDQYYSITFDALEEETTVTFSKSGNSGDKRFIIYGVNALYPEITMDPATYNFGNVRANQTKQQVFTITPNENVSGTLSASITDDANGKYSVGSISEGKVTVTFDPDGAESGTFTAKLRVEASNAAVTADLTGTAIAAEAPEIVVDKNAVAFGRVDPNASVSEAIAVELLHIEGAVSATLGGDDDDKFSLSTTSLSANGNIVVTPNTTENGIYSATLTLSATGAEDVAIPLSITVANKWAVTYTSNVTLTTEGGTSASTAKVKVNGQDTQYDAIKAGTGSVYGAVVVTVPAKTQALHLHAAAWKGETVTLNITGASVTPNSLELTADEGVSNNSPFALSNSPIDQAFDLTIPYSETETAITFTADNGKTGKRFVIYGVNEEGGIHELPEGTTNASTLPEEINLSVGEGKTLNVNSDVTLNNLTVEAGGTVSGSATLIVEDVIIESKSGATNAASGQIIDASKLDVNGDLFMDITLFTSAEGLIDANYWYSVAVPFDVDINSGIYRLDGTTATQLHNSADFDVWYYDTEYRASSQRTGWKRLNGKMQAGHAYLIGFDDGMSNKVRFQAAEGWKTNLFDESGENPALDLVYDSGNSSEHANWNGIANPTMHYMGSDEDVQVFDNDLHTYSSFNKFNYVVGTAFFVKATSESFAIGDVDANNEFRAPKRESENKYEFSVRICKGEAQSFDNQMYVRASEEASAEFDANRDITTMNSATAPSAMLWTENYGGKRLAIEDAPIVNNTASYVLGLYAPKAGQYRIEATDSYDNADLYLTYEGSIIWNLSMGAYELELAKGATSGYGLLLQAKAPQVVTGVDEVDAETCVQKIIIDEHVFILRGGQMYDVTGKTLK